MLIVQAATFVGPASGGLRTVLRHLAGGYAAAGHEVVQVVPGPRDAVTATPYGRLVEVRAPRLGRTGYRLPVEPWRVARLLARLRPDRLEVHDRSTLRGLGRRARGVGVPSLVVSHERLDRLLAVRAPALLRPALPVRALADRSNAALAAGFDAVVTTTGWAATEFDRIGVVTRRVPLGVDLATFRPASGSPRLGDGVLLVHVSRLSPEKRNDLAVGALASLLDAGVPARLVVAGDGAGRDRLRRAAAGLPVTFLGHVADRARLARLLAAADIVLAPGPVETFGLAALEALACGTPVVAHRASALGELLGEPGAGVAVDGTPAAFAAGVRQLLTVPDRRAAARRTAEGYPWSATVDGFLALHREVAA